MMTNLWPAFVAMTFGIGVGIIGCETTTVFVTPNDASAPATDGPGIFGPSTGDKAMEDAGDAGTGPLDSCAAFIACTYETAPAQAAGATAAYGKDGACFATQSDETCHKGCTSGLESLHKLHPTSAACALCTSDAQCGGATPACAADRGECVGCTSSDQCGGASPACDLTAHSCVACVSDANCKGAKPACDTDTHTCVACTSGARCASKSCNADHTCCVPSRTCAGSCGAVSNGCGVTLACGGCSIGTCTNNRCSSVGLACTAGTNSCADGESCMFNAATKGYVCHSLSTAPVDVSVSAPASECDGPSVSTYCKSLGGQFYVCSAEDSVHQWHCQQVCLTSADCSNGKPCSPFFGMTISATMPGYCN